MASSLPAVVDYLAARLRETLPPQVVVADGWPHQRGDDMVVIGVTPDGDAADVVGAYTGLTSGGEEEAVQLPGVVVVHRAGATAAKAARDAAFGYYDELRALVRVDRRLGGAVDPGTPARLATWTVTQTSDVRQAGEGRVCQIQWTLEWVSRV